MRRRVRGQPLRSFGVMVARAFVVVLTVALTVLGVREMVGVISTGVITGLQYVFLALFAINFAWISFALAQALIGFCRHLALAIRSPKDPHVDLKLRTALLVPVYNEAPGRVTAAIGAMADALNQSAPGRFAFFILSDTNQPDAWIEEERHVANLEAHAPAACPVYYRHRKDNRERKAGNIADWVERWGGGYDAMAVMDADSLMDAATLISLALRLQENPDLGLIQTIPRIIRGRSLYARLQQFANRCYGPIYGNGLAFWHGRSSNFWGHNAIIRTRAFAEAARLPELDGKPPFGGHILSHDFAEAAFLRRAGWGVRLDTDLAGSYEEAPPSLIDVLIRDRRWCQGNLQHGRLLFARGFTICSRVHLLSGILSYVSAVSWFLLVITGLMLAIQAQVTRPEYFTEPSLFPQWPVFDAERAIELFIISMGVVLAPKMLGWLAALLNPREMLGFGGPIVLTASLIWEVTLSALYAPVMMLAQTRIVFSVLLGRDGGWKPQRRTNGRIPLEEIVRTHAWHVATGLTLAALAWWIHPDIFWWLLPLTVGLVLAIPLSAASANPLIGRLTRALRLGRTPEEARPPQLARDLEMRLAEQTVAPDAPAALVQLKRDPAFSAWHLAQLAPAIPGETLSDEALVGLAKAEREGDPEILTQWLSRDQAMALLAQPELATWLSPATVSEPRTADMVTA
jgi:membrane glycosyltransferase